MRRRPALDASAAAHAIRAAGGQASRTGVVAASRRLEGWREPLGLPAAPAPPDPHHLRMQALPQLLAAMQACGELPAADAALVERLAGSLRGVGWSAGTMAAALLVLLGRARGAAGPGLAAAAAAVRRAGCSDVHASLAFHLRHLQQHWQVRACAALPSA